MVMNNDVLDLVMGMGVTIGVFLEGGVITGGLGNILMVVVVGWINL